MCKAALPVDQLSKLSACYWLPNAKGLKRIKTAATCKEKVSQPQRRERGGAVLRAVGRVAKTSAGAPCGVYVMRG